MAKEHLPLTESSINKEMGFNVKFSEFMSDVYGYDEISFKVKLSGFEPLGKRITSPDYEIYEADGEILEVKMEFTNLIKKEFPGFFARDVLILVDSEGYQYKAPGNELQEKTVRSYRFSSWSGAKPFLPKIAVECSLLFEVPSYKGEYQLAAIDEY